MSDIGWFIYALLGAAVGSFVNVCIDRLPVGQSLLEPPSHCPACKRQLASWELIPVLSFFLLKGRCRSCGSPIPWRVLLIEVGAGVLFALTWLRFGASLTTIYVSAYGSLLLVLLGIDLEHQRIPNKIVYPAIALALVAAVLTPGAQPVALLLGGAIAFGLLLLIALLLPGGMGMGDVKLTAFIGLIVGYPLVLVMLFFSFLLGGAVAGALLLAGKVGRKESIAFGPFLAVAGMTTLLYGDAILTWWLARI